MTKHQEFILNFILKIKENKKKEIKDFFTNKNVYTMRVWRKKYYSLIELLHISDNFIIKLQINEEREEVLVQVIKDKEIHFEYIDDFYSELFLIFNK